MKITLNDKEYSGLPALLIGIPCCIFVGVVLMATGAVLSSPLWIVVLLSRWLA